MLTNRAKHLGIHPSCKDKKTDPPPEKTLEEKLKACKSKQEVVDFAAHEPIDLELDIALTRKDLDAKIIERITTINNQLP